jgi:hypothetical protein
MNPPQARISTETCRGGLREEGLGGEVLLLSENVIRPGLAKCSWINRTDGLRRLAQFLRRPTPGLNRRDGRYPSERQRCPGPELLQSTYAGKS